GDGASWGVGGSRVLEAGEAAPTRAPTRWEENAARTLEARGCRNLEPGPCAVRHYALATVALRAGRFDVARDAFLRACEQDRGWCSRAAQQPALPWTADERAKL